jgi:hypothetical protein
MTECVEDKGNVDNLKSVLVTRIHAMSEYSVYGPPDLVYLVKERTERHPHSKGLFGGKKRKDTVEILGSFHYVLGVDTSTTQKVIAYLNSLMDTKPVQAGGSAVSVKVVNAIYCTYDMFTKIDVQLRPKEGGQTEVSAIGQDGKQATITNWNTVFISG